MTQIISTTFAERLRIIREQAGLNPRQMALSAGIDPSQYQKAEKGQQKLGSEKIFGLATKYGINAQWILTGEGEMKAAAHGQYTTSQPDTKTPGLVKEPGENWREKYYATLEEKARLIDETARRSIQLADTAIARLDAVERTANDNELMIVALRRWTVEHFAALSDVPIEEMHSDLNSVVIEVGREYKRDRMMSADR